MKAFATALFASAFALTATLATAQSAPHHPLTHGNPGPSTIEEGAPAQPGQPTPQKPESDMACPENASSMMQMMQMIEGTQLQIMQNMQRMQEEMQMMQERLKDIEQPGEAAP